MLAELWSNDLFAVSAHIIVLIVAAIAFALYRTQRKAEHFARSWARERGRRALLAVDQRIYQLTQVSWPAPVSGGCSQPSTGDEWQRSTI